MVRNKLDAGIIALVAGLLIKAKIILGSLSAYKIFAAFFVGMTLSDLLIAAGTVLIAAHWWENRR